MPKRFPRMFACLLAAALALLAVVALSPQQGPVVLYKAALVPLAGVAGYWLDRWIFPYSRPDGYLNREWTAHGVSWPEDRADFEVVPEYRQVFAAVMLRRALIVFGAMLAVGFGL